jgi:hypothetical protein
MENVELRSKLLFGAKMATMIPRKRNRQRKRKSDEVKQIILDYH